MKAAVYGRYGSADVVSVSPVPTPVPGDDEVLVRVRAATVGIVDSLARRGSPFYARPVFGFLRPRRAVLGSDFAGQVAAVGRSVTSFGVGDSVYGTVAPRFGAHAEYVCLPEDGALALMPSNVSYAEAAALVDATALVFLRDKAGVRAGQTVLINGASGAVGVAAVQLAAHFGGVVTGVCSGPGAELVRSLGASEVVDYTRADFTRDGPYDVIFDVAGVSSFGRCRGALADGGVYLTTAPSVAVLVPRFGRRRAAVAFTGLRPASEKRRDLVFLKSLAEASALVPVVEGCYPLERIADAHRRVDAGHKKGNVVVTMTG